MTFRKVFFWLHLVAGVVAATATFIMFVTGGALAFEKEIVAKGIRTFMPVIND